MRRFEQQDVVDVALGVAADGGRYAGGEVGYIFPQHTYARVNGEWVCTDKIAHNAAPDAVKNAVEQCQAEQAEAGGHAQCGGDRRKRAGEAVGVFQADGPADLEQITIRRRRPARAPAAPPDPRNRRRASFQGPYRDAIAVTSDPPHPMSSHRPIPAFSTSTAIS